MRFPTPTIFAIAGLAAGQSSMGPNTSSACSDAVEAIIDSCLSSTLAQLNACAGNDWGCMCDSQQQVVTCFNNCPADSRTFGAQQQLSQWCGAARAYDPESLAATRSTSATAGSTFTMAATTTVGVMNAASYSAMSFTPSITGSGANAMNTNAAGGVGANVGGLAALVFGAAALL